MKKVITIEQIPRIVKQIKLKDQTIVLAGGCFDIIHKGHFEFLKNAKEEGDVLIILLESDETVRKLKGSTRPINSQLSRAQTLENVTDITYIILLPPLKTSLEYLSVVKQVKPDIIAITHGDSAKIVKEKQAREVGARVVEVISRISGYSTSEILKARDF